MRIGDEKIGRPACGPAGAAGQASEGKHAKGAGCAPRGLQPMIVIMAVRISHLRIARREFNLKHFREELLNVQTNVLHNQRREAGKRGADAEPQEASRAGVERAATREPRVHAGGREAAGAARHGPRGL